MRLFIPTHPVVCGCATGIKYTCTLYWKNHINMLHCVSQICDFGLAKWKQHAATQTTTKIRRGTVAYMAPEVHNDPGISRTIKYDVYSFGILLWALLSGERPFENGTLLILYI